MASVTRRLQRHLAWRPAPKAADVIAIDDGFRLCRELERHAKAAGAPDTMHFLEYLRQMRRGYDPEFDGRSRLMDLVDEIGAFEVREAERIKEKFEQMKARAS